MTRREEKEGRSVLRRYKGDHAATFGPGRKSRRATKTPPCATGKDGHGCPVPLQLPNYETRKLRFFFDLDFYFGGYVAEDADGYRVFAQGADGFL